jgi:hypothetical protein
MSQARDGGPAVDGVIGILGHQTGCLWSAGEHRHALAHRMPRSAPQLISTVNPGAAPNGYLHGRAEASGCSS